MAERQEGKDVNPAQVRGDIDRGLTGDKRPGFDPAAAPLETDAEAGGASQPAAELDAARDAPRQDQQPREGLSFGSAMRPTTGSPNRSRRSILTVVLLLAGLGLVLLLLLGLF